MTADDILHDLKPPNPAKGSGLETMNQNFIDGQQRAYINPEPVIWHRGPAAELVELINVISGQTEPEGYMTVTGKTREGVPFQHRYVITQTGYWRKGQRYRLDPPEVFSRIVTEKYDLDPNKTKVTVSKGFVS